MPDSVSIRLSFGPGELRLSSLFVPKTKPLCLKSTSNLIRDEHLQRSTSENLCDQNGIFPVRRGDRTLSDVEGDARGAVLRYNSAS